MSKAQQIWRKGTCSNCHAKKVPVLKIRNGQCCGACVAKMQLVEV